MKRTILMLLLSAALALPATAKTQVVARDLYGLSGINSTCLLLGCTVTKTLDGSEGQLFLVKPSLLSSVTSLLGALLTQPGIVDAELDATLTLTSSSISAPPALYDQTPVNYYGTTVWQGYVTQPAVGAIGLSNEQSAYPSDTGSGIVAVIDTGVDPTTPALANVLLPGYDFVHNVSGGSELNDLSSDPGTQTNTSAAELNQSTVAMLDQSTVAMLDGSSSYADFGHGTMTAGIVHLVAPTAQIMPLKAFTSSGSAQESSVLQAIYYASQNGAKVISMSFDFPTYSQELDRATQYATSRNLILVASAGNEGKQIQVWPASLTSNVIGVGSTDSDNDLSTFSNFGSQVLWVAAPGEGIVTTYPFGTYAAGWGTSFSAPFVAGTAALLVSVSNGVNQGSAQNAIGHAQSIGANANMGLLQVLNAVGAWRQIVY
jgi:subtilisin family serine protease